MNTVFPTAPQPLTQPSASTLSVQQPPQIRQPGLIRVLAAFAGVLLTVTATSGLQAHGVAQSSDATSATAEARQINFPDTSQGQTLVVDLHTHSVFSDGHVWPKIRVEEALRDGLDALAITEHLEWQPHRADIPHADRNRAIDEAKAAAVGSELMIISGSEITREAPAGHINAVFISDANKLLNVAEPPADTTDVRGYYIAANSWPAQNAVDAANAQGAFVFWNHPYWTEQQPDGIAQMNKFHRANLRADKLHGIEIANGADYSEESHAIAMRYNLTMLGVSDVHDLIDWDYNPAEGGHRPVTLVFSEARSADALRDALFAGRTVVWFKNLLIGRAAQLQPLLEASLSVTDVAYIDDTTTLGFTLHNHSDANLELHYKGKLTFAQHSDRFVVPAHDSIRMIIKPGDTVAQLELPIEVENALIAPRKRAKISLNVVVPADTD